MAAGLSVYSFRGDTTINDGITYQSLFLLNEGAGYDSFAGNSIESDRPDNWPVFVRLQPGSLRFTIEVHLLKQSQANLDNLKQLFSPLAGRGFLLLKSNNGESPTDTRQLYCQPEKILAAQLNIFKVSMLSSIGVFEAVDLTVKPTVHVITSGQTFNVTRVGTAPSFPTFTLTPKTSFLNTESWIKYRNLVIVNRSEMPLYGPDGEEYPILIGDVSDWSITPGQDVRVLLDGEEVIRYFDGNKLWAGLQFASAKTFTLADALDNSSLPDIYASNADTFLGWPNSGYFVVGNEAIKYSNINGFLKPTQRGALGTTATTHSIGTIAYWVEHPNLVLIWDYTLAQPALEPDDQKPVIDLANSDNTHWIWNGPFFNNQDLRLAAWRKEYTEETPANPNVKYIRGYEEGGKATFENAIPLSGKTLANNMVMEVPCGLSQTGAALQLTQGHSGTTPIPIDGVSYHKKVTITSYSYEQIDTGELYTVQSGEDDTDVLTSTKRVLQQFITLETLVSDTFPNALGQDSEQTVYVTMDTGNFLPPVSGAGGVTYFLQHERQVVPLNVTHTAYSQEKSNALFPYQTLTQMVLKAFGTDKQGFEALITLDAALAVPVFRVRLNVSIPIGIDLEGLPFTESPIPIQTGTGDKTTLDDIAIAFDTTRTPRVIVGSQVILYMLNGRLQNNNTGDYLDLSIPAQINQPFQIDCENHIVTDLNNGVEIPHTIAASNPRYWLYNDKGVNVYSFTLVGISAGNGDIDIDESHRECWL